MAAVCIRLSGSVRPGMYQIDDLLEYIRLAPEDPCIVREGPAAACSGSRISDTGDS